MKSKIILALLILLSSGCAKQIIHEETRQPSPRERASVQLTQEGKQFLKEGKPDNAIRLLEQAIGLNPDNGECYFYLAQAWLKKEIYSEAKKFNSLAQIYLKNDKNWMIRLEKQANQIERKGQYGQSRSPFGSNSYDR